MENIEKAYNFLKDDLQGISLEQFRETLELLEAQERLSLDDLNSVAGGGFKDFLKSARGKLGDARKAIQETTRAVQETANLVSDVVGIIDNTTQNLESIVDNYRNK